MFNLFPLLKKGIRSKFLKMLLILTATFLTGMLSFFLYVNEQNKKLQNERELLFKKAELVDELQENFNGIFFRARGYYAFQNNQELNLLKKDLKNFEVLLNQFSQLPLSKEEKELYKELIDFNKNYKEIILPKAIGYVKENDYKSLRKLSSNGTNELVNKFLDYTKSYQKKTDGELNQLFKETIVREQEFTLISLILSGIIILFIGLIMRRVLNNIIRPIEQLTSATNAFAHGKPFELGSLVSREDEFGVLANSYYRMIQSIQEKEEALTTQNEELLAQQDELQEHQWQLQNSVSQLEKSNQLNHVLTFTLDKQNLIEKLHNYLNDIYKLDMSVLYWLEGNVYATKGLSKESAIILVENIDIDKRVRLEEEKSFIIKRKVLPNAHGIAQEPYYCYDLYSSILNSEGHLVAVMIATREGYSYSNQEIDSLNGLLNRVSIAFERILMYEEVERSRQLNQNIIDNVNEGIQLVSATGDVVLMNVALCKIVQCEKKLEGKNISKKSCLNHFRNICINPEELIEFFDTAVRESFKDTRKFRYSISKEIEVFVEVYATSIYEGSEKVGTIFVHRDITKEYEIDQMKSELVSTVSHELRTPLSSVLGFTELLLTKKLKPERQQKYIETINKEAIRLKNLINDFLDLQRMESGKQQYNMQSLLLNEIVFELLNRYRQEKNHNVHLIDKAIDIQVKADQERLIQVFINLIDNAIKFSPNGGNVTITLENTSNLLQVSIKDDGIGIPKQSIPQLFQKFKRIDNSSRRKIGGTGLGLSICREIITKHGGEIWLESEEGKGTTVYFTLPVEGRKLMVENIGQPEDFLEGEQGLNVMIVEDDWSLALLLSEELKSKGFTVIHHYDPERAFEKALKIPLVGIVIDLVLTDDVDGWYLVHQLKETKQTSGIPIVISSALDEPKEKVDKYEIVKYFTKPYPPELLSEVFVELLKNDSEKCAVTKK
ncbi:ATP-binding protein [Rummeliibacillus sp. NPDC094406]|uniref:ATP-binding protein n=1 Tax=Rummeliibacillus sp. NPDC094406 TaxID=3364511 RepID=UPI0037FEA172